MIQKIVVQMSLQPSEVIMDFNWQNRNEGELEEVKLIALPEDDDDL